MPEGVLSMLKAPGMTSHDVVDGVRRILQVRKVGHTGTLDPAAAGVIVVMVGATTRLSEFLMGCDKSYRAEITFGIATDSLDGEGEVLARESAKQVEAAGIERALERLTGALHMPPPMHSAVWHQGRRLYEIARAGGSVEAKSRESVVHRFELLDFEPGETARALTEIECSSGTYVRSLAALVGEAVGCPAYLSFLVRTAVGAQTLEDSLTGSELAARVREHGLESVLVAPQEALPPAWPRLEIDRAAAVQLCRGIQIPAPAETVGQSHTVVLLDGRLICVAEIIEENEERLLQPRRVVLSEEELLR